MPNQPPDHNLEKAESKNDRLADGADKALRRAITTSDRQELTETALAQQNQEASNRLLTPEEAAVLARRQQKVVGDATGALGFSPSLDYTAADGSKTAILPGRRPEDVATLSKLQEQAKSLPFDPDELVGKARTGKPEDLIAHDPTSPIDFVTDSSGKPPETDQHKPADLTQAGKPFKPFFDAVGGMTSGSTKALQEGLEHLKTVTGVNPESSNKPIGPARNPGDALNTLGGAATSTVRGLDGAARILTKDGIVRQANDAASLARELGSYLGDKVGKNELHTVPGDALSAGKIGLDKIVDALAAMNEDSSVERGELAGIAVLFFAANGDFIKDARKQGLFKLSEQELKTKGFVRKEVDLEVFSKALVLSLEGALGEKSLVSKDGFIPKEVGLEGAKLIADRLRPVCSNIDYKNIAFSELDFNGERIITVGINGKDAPAGTAVCPESPLFHAIPKGAMPTNQDSEYKILEQVGAYLKNWQLEHGKDPEGAFSLFSEQKPCMQSCDKVIQEFKKQFPGIRFESATWAYPKETMRHDAIKRNGGKR